MAVPARRTSKVRRKQTPHSSQNYSSICTHFDETTGDYSRSHRVSSKDTTKDANRQSCNSRIIEGAIMRVNITL